MKYILIGIMVISLPVITDWMVDHNRAMPTYTVKQASALRDLQARELDHEVSAEVYLFGERRL